MLNLRRIKITMGKTDDFTGNMMEVNTYFADALNSAVYNGAKVVSPSDLQPYSERKANTGKIRNGNAVTERMFRDVIKEVRENDNTGLLACIAGVENQTELSRIMPARVMRYDGREYVHQGEDLCSTVEEKIAGMPSDSYLIPIVTVVINFSDRKWDQPRSIHELIYPKYRGKELMKYVPDYFINVLDPYDMEDEEIERMESNLREVMYTVKYSSDKEKLAEIVRSSRRFSDLDAETANFIEHFGNIKLNRNERGGYDMCRAIQEMKAEIAEEKTRADEAETRAGEEKTRADEAETRADRAESELAKYIAKYGKLDDAYEK